MSTEIGSRVYQSMQSYFELWTDTICERLTEHCESPIEVMFGAALTMAKRLHSRNNINLWAQYEWNQYRFDFAVGDGTGNLLIFLECDGHEFHERTKEQAAYDRQKDRAALAAGIPILRFTGSEIYRDALNCALETIRFLDKQTARKVNPNMAGQAETDPPVHEDNGATDGNVITAPVGLVERGVPTITG